MLFIEIPLPNQKSITDRKISILQVINERLSIRLPPKLFMSLSKVYVNQGGVDRYFLINEVNLLFYIITGNPQHKTWENCTPKHSISEKWKVKHKFYLKWAFFWWLKYLIIQWMLCGGLAENKYPLTLYVHPFLIFFVIWNIVSKTT